MILLAVVLLLVKRAVTVNNNRKMQVAGWIPGDMPKNKKFDLILCVLFLL